MLILHVYLVTLPLFDYMYVTVAVQKAIAVHAHQHLSVPVKFSKEDFENILWTSVPLKPLNPVLLCFEVTAIKLLKYSC